MLDKKILDYTTLKELPILFTNIPTPKGVCSSMREQKFFYSSHKLLLPNDYLIL